MTSFSFKITLFVLKLKGIKKAFSTDPVNYKKLRKDDVIKPPKRNNISGTQGIVGNSTIHKIIPKCNFNKKQLIIFIPGGAFVSGPGKHHWDKAFELVTKTRNETWLINYPKAPEYTIETICSDIDDIYNAALKEYKSNNIHLIGDSVGGNIITTLTQRLINKKISLPKSLVLITPVMDAQMNNPSIKTIEKHDPILNINGVLSAKKMVAGELALNHSLLSPLHYSVSGFPPTLIFLGERDIMYPDCKLALQKMKKQNVVVSSIEIKEMPHIWPLLPVMKEAKVAFNIIISHINNNGE